MRFSECRKRPVLDTTTAQEVGRVDGFVVDAAYQRVHAVVVGKHDGGSILPWSEVHGFGPDAVTVSSPTAIREPAEGLDREGDLLGSRVLTDRGFELGTVQDVEFDPASGKLEQLLLEERTIDGAALRGYGSYAVIVRHPDDGTSGPR